MSWVTWLEIIVLIAIIPAAYFENRRIERETKELKYPPQDWRTK